VKVTVSHARGMNFEARAGDGPRVRLSGADGDGTGPRPKESIDSPKELFWFAQELGWGVADCGDGGGRERYQLAHKANEWALMRWREAGLRLTDQQRADVFLRSRLGPAEIQAA